MVFLLRVLSKSYLLWGLPSRWSAFNLRLNNLQPQTTRHHQSKLNLSDTSLKICAYMEQMNFSQKGFLTAFKAMYE